ncbi:hypothetical protein Ndes2526A_g01187 [Nannochloris sp. 'desiccata']
MGNTSSSQSYDTQSNLAKKLAQKRPLLIAFLQPSCGLCKSLEPQLAQTEASGVQVARLDSSNAVAWAPEMLAYNIEAVPCFVLLDHQGRALGKSDLPRNTLQMQHALTTLLSKSYTS